MEEERKMTDFEKWADKEGFDISKDIIWHEKELRVVGYDYSEEATKDARAGWNAAIEHAALKAMDVLNVGSLNAVPTYIRAMTEGTPAISYEPTPSEACGAGDKGE